MAGHATVTPPAAAAPPERCPTCKRYGPRVDCPTCAGTGQRKPDES